MLTGLKVIELATYIAAPGAGGMLADWGADVIKIEAPDGDPIRRFFETLGADNPGNPVFDLDNRGKRGIVVDIAKPDGRLAVLKLVENADVFLTNLRPGALARAGLDWLTLSNINPRLIFSSVTGYGLEGPDADKPGFDLAAFWAMSGVAALTIPKGVEPFPIRTATGDHTCSLATVAAILAAVVDRQNTGRGRLVETSLLRSGVYSVGSDMAIALRYGRVASNRPRPDAVNLLPRQGSADWPRIARAAGRADLLDDPRFSGAKLRRQNGPALVAELDKGFSAMDFETASMALDREDVVWSPIRSALEVVASREARDAGCFTEMSDGSGGLHLSPSTPVRFPGEPERPKGPAPTLGQHTDQILQQAGYADTEIQQLRDLGIIA
jgi:crotonobetainyl-CoA:carnitine CoA-transferase CaiB-like acyl-CoA transferase